MRPPVSSEEPRSMAGRQSEPAHHAASSAALPRSRPRNDDSWIEVSSRPSSSSLSSVADEIITTGLRVQQDPRIPRRRRRLRRSLPENVRLGTQLRSQAASSSQEEYDESESESDQVLSSSNEGMQSETSPQTGINQESEAVAAGSSQNQYVSDDGYADDDDENDENSTAIGTAGSFRPQPNAFSHPPVNSSRQNSSSVPQSEARRPSRPNHQRHSFPSQHQHSPYNVISPSHHVDHDAALRASLSTLLSYAAATRGLPKSGSQANRPQGQPVVSNRIDTATLGLVPESVAMGEAEPDSIPGDQTNAADKGKRKALTTAATSNSRSNSKDRRAVKKPRRTIGATYAVAGLEDVSPTLLTWVVGAGVLVLVSAISFSAGYVVGRETGHAEAAASISGAGASVVKRELVAAKTSGLGLRRFTGVAVGATA